MMRRHTFLLAAIPALGAAALLSPQAVANTHTTNGQFDTNEWTLGPTDPTLINPATERAQTFAFNPATSRGGAVLYVEQSSNGQGGQNKFGTTLDLMYDYVASPTVLGAGSNATNSSMDVFFQVPGDADYIVHITGTGFSAFEKPENVPSAENADGTLHFENAGVPIAPWTTLTSADLALANFHAVLGFNQSPNSSAPHLMAEFDLTINSQGSPAGGGNPGIYDPAPAFWSAGGKSGTADPPISSEIFNLQPDGSINAGPVENSAGDPVAQPSDVPEPTSMGLLLVGAGLLARRRARR
jgi:hypothetical protein